MAFSGKLIDFAQRFAPILVLHPAEPYLPTSVDWYIQRTNYFPGSGAMLQPGTWSFSGASGTQKVPAGPDGYLSIPGDDSVTVFPPGNDVFAVRQGSIADAKAYVHARPVPGRSDQIDLQYWFFYAFNGPEYLYVASFYHSPATADFNQSFHQGDWEFVTVRVDNNDNIVAVRLSQHSGGVWYMQPATTKSGGGYQTKGKQVVVYAARGSHALYPAPGGPHMIGSLINKLGYTIGLADFTGNGTQVDYSGKGRLVLADNDLPGVFADQPDAATAAWVAFQGHWGPNMTRHISYDDLAAYIQTLLTGMPVESTLLTYLAPGTVALAALIAALIPLAPELPYQDGPANPPIQRAWSEAVEPISWPKPQLLPLYPGTTVLPGYRGPQDGYQGSAVALGPADIRNAEFYFWPNLLLDQQVYWHTDTTRRSLIQKTKIASTNGVTGIITVPSGQSTGLIQCFLLTMNGAQLMLWNAGDATSQTWQAVTSMPATQATSLGALAWSNNTLLCAYRQNVAANPAPLAYITLGNSTWSTEQTIDATKCWRGDKATLGPAPVAATLASGMTVIVYATPSNDPMNPVGLAAVTTTDFANWAGPYALPVDVDYVGDNTPSVVSAPALASDGTSLFCAFIDGLHQLRLTQSLDGEQWSDPVIVAQSLNPLATPTLVVDQQGLLMIATIDSVGGLTGTKIAYWGATR
jgi:hypothetical protein